MVCRIWQPYRFSVDGESARIAESGLSARLGRRYVIFASLCHMKSMVYKKKVFFRGLTNVCMFASFSMCFYCVSAREMTRGKFLNILEKPKNRHWWVCVCVCVCVCRVWVWTNEGVRVWFYVCKRVCLCAAVIICHSTQNESRVFARIDLWQCLRGVAVKWTEQMLLSHAFVVVNVYGYWYLCVCFCIRLQNHKNAGYVCTV
jgi:hypothetical protein